MDGNGTPTVIICGGVLGVVHGGGRDPSGQYLRDYDPEAHGGMGEARWTADPAKARVFASFGEAFECWRQVPRSRPRRPDGKPNRPLTAYTVRFEHAPEGAGTAV